MTETDPQAALDIDRLKELANLPLDDDERETLGQACQDVLDAFELPHVEPHDLDTDEGRLFEDDPEPWPPNEVDHLLDQVPRHEGREIQP